MELRRKGSKEFLKSGEGGDCIVCAFPEFHNRSETQATCECHELLLRDPLSFGEVLHVGSGVIE
jgi:hypothetical protein